MLQPILSYTIKNTSQSVIHRPTVLLCALLFLNLFFLGLVFAEQSYIKCWKNSNGITECGNRIPREYFNDRIRYIDEKGVTRKIKERTKTKKELDSELEMQALLALENEQKDKLKKYDDVLLKTYLSIDDLLISLNSKLEIIKSRSNILQSSLELKKRQFGNLVRQAADMERSGKNISIKLASQLEKSRHELKNMQTRISNEKKDIQRIRLTFAHDVERFIVTSSDRIKHLLATPSQAKKLHAVRLSCLTKIQCDLHWQKAKDFVKKFSTTKVLYETNKIIVSDTPEAQQDIAMSLSLINSSDTNEEDEHKYLIFQIRCNRERQGQEFCKNEEIDELLKEFKSIMFQ